MRLIPKNTLFLFTLASSCVLVCSQGTPNNPLITLESGLQYQILQPPTDPNSSRPRQGQLVTIEYSAWLECNNRKFESNTIEFCLGMNLMVRGLEEGLRLMRAGQVCKFIIPPHLGYGRMGTGWTVPPNATLIFEVKLIKIEDPDKP